MFGFIFLVASILCFGVAFYFYQKSRAFQSKAQKATGVVKDFKKQGGVNFPIIEFTPPNGNPITFKSDIGSSPPSYKVGEQVRVSFEPDSPHSASIDSFFHTYMEALICCALGGLSFLIGIILTLAL